MTESGEFVEHLFYDGRSEAIALTKGNILNVDNILVRIHSHCVSGHIFNGVECDCRQQMRFSQDLIQKNELGIIIWLDQEGKGNGHFAKVLSDKYKRLGRTQEEAYRLCGYKEDSRTYEFAHMILEYFNISRIRLITNHQRKQNMVSDLGVVISEIINTK